MERKKQKRYSRRYCIAAGCRNVSVRCPDLGFFSLPGDEKRRRQWLIAISREDLLEKLRTLKTRAKSYEVCQAHFTDSMFKVVKQLRPNAMPVNHLPNLSLDGLPNDEDCNEPSNTKESEDNAEKSDTAEDFDDSTSDDEPIVTQTKIPIAQLDIPPLCKALVELNRKRKLATARQTSKNLWKELKISSRNVRNKDDASGSGTTK